MLKLLDLVHLHDLISFRLELLIENATDVEAKPHV